MHLVKISESAVDVWVGLQAAVTKGSDCGYIDWYGYHAAAGGWFCYGWIRGAELADATAELSGWTARMIFENGEIEGPAHVARFIRDDVRGVGIGAVVHVSAADAQCGACVGIVVRSNGNDHPLLVVRAAPRIDATEEMEARIVAVLPLAIADASSVSVAALIARQPLEEPGQLHETLAADEAESLTVAPQSLIAAERTAASFADPAASELRPATASPNLSSHDDYVVGNELSDAELVERNFDYTFYRARNQDLQGLSDAQLLQHYLRAGWRERRDPSPRFSVTFYLSSYPDIAQANIDPFLHFLRHGYFEYRLPAPYMQRRLAAPGSFKISVIVPNYNHARFLPARLNSILDQSYASLELIVLDDASTDSSVQVIREYLARRGIEATVIARETNSGSVFRQWRTGIEAARGDLIWICESDDLAELDFLERLVPYFNDPSVMVAFGRIQFCDMRGRPTPGLDGYREGAEAGIWAAPCVRPANEWFQGAFGVANVIANVGGCLLRNQPIEPEVWETALNYKILGDWYLYMVLAGGGRIAFEPMAVTYFRQHGANTSVKSFSKPYYYREHQAVAVEMRKQWGVGDAQALRLFERTLSQFRYAEADKLFGRIDSVFDLSAILSTERAREHILIGFLGFHLGGGELFPIHLANELVRRGYMVSALIVESRHAEPGVRAKLDRRIPVYEADLVREIGTREFLRRAGITAIHTHNVGVEFLFFNEAADDVRLPYVVTLHGSYEVTPLPDHMLFRLLKNVSRWTCLAKNNLAHLRCFPVDPAAISFVPNGLPVDERPFERTRADLRIPAGAVVFTIASRAIAEKGWEMAIRALEKVAANTKTPLVLLLAGSGPELERLRELYADATAVRFLGFQTRICGLFRISDCVLLPTRFPGESFPLCLIEAMQCGRPVIATRVGEISRMVTRSDGEAGILIEPTPDDDEFVDSLAVAMTAMVDPQARAAYAQTSARFGEDYDIRRVAERYLALYAEARDEPARRADVVLRCLAPA